MSLLKDVTVLFLCPVIGQLSSFQDVIKNDRRTGFEISSNNLCIIDGDILIPEYCSDLWIPLIKEQIGPSLWLEKVREGLTSTKIPVEIPLLMYISLNGRS